MALRIRCHSARFVRELGGARHSCARRRRASRRCCTSTGAVPRGAAGARDARRPHRLRPSRPPSSRPCSPSTAELADAPRVRFRARVAIGRRRRRCTRSFDRARAARRVKLRRTAGALSPRSRTSSVAVDQVLRARYLINDARTAVNHLHRGACAPASRASCCRPTRTTPSSSPSPARRCHLRRAPCAVDHRGDAPIEWPTPRVHASASRRRARTRSSPPPTLRLLRAARRASRRARRPARPAARREGSGGRTASAAPTRRAAVDAAAPPPPKPPRPRAAAASRPISGRQRGTRGGARRAAALGAAGALGGAAAGGARAARPTARRSRRRCPSWARRRRCAGWAGWAAIPRRRRRAPPARSTARASSVGARWTACGDTSSRSACTRWRRTARPDERARRQGRRARRHVAQAPPSSRRRLGLGAASDVVARVAREWLWHGVTPPQRGGVAATPRGGCTPPRSTVHDSAGEQLARPPPSPSSPRRERPQGLPELPPRASRAVRREPRALVGNGAPRAARYAASAAPSHQRRLHRAAMQVAAARAAHAEDGASTGGADVRCRALALRRRARPRNLLDRAPRRLGRDDGGRS